MWHSSDTLEQLLSPSVAINKMDWSSIGYRKEQEVSSLIATCLSKPTAQNGHFWSPVYSIVIKTYKFAFFPLHTSTKSKYHAFWWHCKGYIDLDPTGVVSLYLNRFKPPIAIFSSYPSANDIPNHIIWKMMGFRFVLGLATLIARAN
jgi:hypothetical protein